MAGMWGGPVASAASGGTAKHPSATPKRHPEYYQGGRHPQWRGCDHRYQPTLTAWVYSAGPLSMTKVPAGVRPFWLLGMRVGAILPLR